MNQMIEMVFFNQSNLRATNNFYEVVQVIDISE